MAKKDLIGMRFGKLVVLSDSGQRGKGGNVKWTCRCDCGKTTIVTGNNLKSKSILSCGCHRSDRMTKRNSKHLMAHSLTYYVWDGIKKRCTNPKSPNFHLYGGRVINVCDRWLNSFDNFLADMGEKPPGMSIDRIDVNGDYQPSNCRWATAKEQCNNKRSNTLITYNGETKTLSQWSEILGINYMTLWGRITKSKKSIEEAFNTPIRKRKKTGIRASEL